MCGSVFLSEPKLKRLNKFIFFQESVKPVKRDSFDGEVVR